MRSRTVACALLLAWLGCAGVVSAHADDGARLDQAAPDRKSIPQAAREQAQVEAVYRIYRAGDVATAARLYGQLAERGNRVAQFNLGVMHVVGEAPDANPATAIVMLRRSAAQGFAPAMRALGQSYEQGTVTGRDLDESTRWYERAAEAGDVDAAVSAGTAYYLGRGAPRDMRRAAGLFLQAARGGDAGAQYLYASMAEAGDGIAKDLRIARYWYDAAAKNGEVGAVYEVRELDALLQ